LKENQHEEKYGEEHQCAYEGCVACEHQYAGVCEGHRSECIVSFHIAPFCERGEFLGTGTEVVRVISDH